MRSSRFEVVERQSEAQVSNLLEQSDRRVPVLHQRALGDLQIQEARIELRLFEDVRDDSGEVLAVLDLPHGYVDRDSHGRQSLPLPLQGLLDGRAQDPLPEWE